MFQMLDVDNEGGMKHVTILMLITIHCNQNSLTCFEFSILTIFDQKMTRKFFER